MWVERVDGMGHPDRFLPPVPLLVGDVVFFPKRQYPVLVDVMRLPPPFGRSNPLRHAVGVFAFVSSHGGEDVARGRIVAGLVARPRIVLVERVGVVAVDDGVVVEAGDDFAPAVIVISVHAAGRFGGVVHEPA